MSSGFPAVAYDEQLAGPRFCFKLGMVKAFLLDRRDGIFQESEPARFLLRGQEYENKPLAFTNVRVGDDSRRAEVGWYYRSSVGRHRAMALPEVQMNIVEFYEHVREYADLTHGFILSSRVVEQQEPLLKGWRGESIEVLAVARVIWKDGTRVDHCQRRKLLDRLGLTREDNASSSGETLSAFCTFPPA